MHHPTDRIAHTTAFVTPVVEHWLEREIAQWVHPMKDQSDDPLLHEWMLLPRSYISLRVCVYAYAYVCIYVCVCIYIYIYIYIYIPRYVCVSVCVCVCVCLHVCACTYIHTVFLQFLWHQAWTLMGFCWLGCTQWPTACWRTCWVDGWAVCTEGWTPRDRTSCAPSCTATWVPVPSIGSLSCGWLLQKELAVSVFCKYTCIGCTLYVVLCVKSVDAKFNLRPITISWQFIVFISTFFSTFFSVVYDDADIFNDKNGHFYQVAIAVKISNLLICLCCFELFCAIFEKDNFIENLYIVLSCLIK